jgi:hypothetical protein
VLQRKVDIRHKGPLARRTGVVTALDNQTQTAPAGRGREFRDALTRAVGAIPGVPFSGKEWNWWLR